MKAISLWQPWATLWLLSNPDEKIFETRHWYTSHRGPLLVHAAKKRDGEVRDALAGGPLVSALLRHGFRADDEEGRHLAFGALIGCVDLIGVRRTENVDVSERERSAGNWQPGRYAWERGPKPLLFETPIPWKGSQGFFEVECASDFILPEVRRKLAGEMGPRS